VELYHGGSAWKNSVHHRQEHRHNTPRPTYRGDLKSLPDVEKEPSTWNTHYFNDYRRQFFTLYKGIYNRISFIGRLRSAGYQSSEFKVALEKVISNLRKIGFHNVQPLELAVLRASEDSDDAIKIMADVRAYFQGM
jgi:hypothetical protein